MWKCPNCNEEISHVQYRQSLVEYGTASLPSQEVPNGDLNSHLSHDMDESDSSDPAEYSCPECGDEITISRIVWIPEGATVPSGFGPAPVIIDEVSHDIVHSRSGTMSSDRMRQLTILCPLCQFSNINISTTERYIECEGCHETISCTPSPATATRLI